MSVGGCVMDLTNERTERYSFESDLKDTRSSIDDIHTIVRCIHDCSHDNDTPFVKS